MQTIDNKIYDRIHATWWEDDGFMALLRTSVNPPRFAYFRTILAQRLGRDPAGLTVLDVGCGGGLLSEQFAALGCKVTGVDRSVPTLSAAKAHALASGLAITYLEGTGESLPFDAGQFDIVCCCDVLEHVDELDPVVADISRVLKPGGIFFFDTINRTLLSKLVAIKLAQDCPLTRLIPRNLHVWEKFIRPDELSSSMERHGFSQSEFTGLAPSMNPFTALASLVRHKLGNINFAELGKRMMLRKSKNLSISYMGFAIRSL